MPKIFNFCSVILVYCSVVLVSCNPEEVQTTENVDDYLDSAFDLILEGSTASDLCGITSIDSSKNSYHLYFDRGACNGKITRDGEIVVTLIKGKDWSEKNAEMKISYLDYEIEVLGQEDSGPRNFFSKRTITGTQYVTNVSGGEINDFLDGKISHLERKTVAQDLSVTFNDNALAQRYNEVSIREFNKEGDVTLLLSRGDTTISDYTNVQEWGVDVFNQRFYRTIEEPIIKTLCDNGKRWKFTSGAKVIYSRNQFGENEIRRKVFGVNQNGEPDGTCACYGFKITLEKQDGQIEETVYKY